jgi:transcriptional regulator of NAD metabolism
MIAKALILVIHSHPIAGEMLVSLIEEHRPLCQALLVENFEKALVELKRRSVHLIIADLENVAPQSTFASIAMVNGWNPPIPFIAIEEGFLAEDSALAGGITVLPPPVDVKVLLELIDTMTMAAQESVLNGISLKVFLQMLELEHKTCSLRVISGYETGRLHLRDGRLVAAQTGALRDRAAVTSILDWPNCTITVTEGTHAAETMNVSIQTILMEWCISQDEGQSPRIIAKAALS